MRGSAALRVPIALTWILSADSDHAWRRQNLRRRRLCDTACYTNTSDHRSPVDGRKPLRLKCAVSQRIRKRMEEAFGQIKAVARQKKTCFRGRDRLGWTFTLAAAAYNLVGLPKLMAGGRLAEVPQIAKAFGASSRSKT